MNTTQTNNHEDEPSREREREREGERERERQRERVGNREIARDRERVEKGERYQEHNIEGPFIPSAEKDQCRSVGMEDEFHRKTSAKPGPHLALFCWLAQAKTH